MQVGAAGAPGRLVVDSGATLSGPTTRLIVNSQDQLAVDDQGTISAYSGPLSGGRGCKAYAGTVRVDGTLTCNVDLEENTRSATSWMTTLLGKGTVTGDVYLYDGQIAPGVDALSPEDTAPGTLTVTGGLTPTSGHADPEPRIVVTFGTSGAHSTLALGSNGGSLGAAGVTVVNDATGVIPEGTTFDVITGGQGIGGDNGGPTVTASTRPPTRSRGAPRPAAPSASASPPTAPPPAAPRPRRRQRRRSRRPSPARCRTSPRSPATAPSP